MNHLDKKGDNLNPDISFNPTTGQLSIQGQSISVDVERFFGDVIQWLEQYAESPQKSTQLKIDLKYLNGKSLRTLLALLYTLKEISAQGKEVNVEWTIPTDADDLNEISRQLLHELQLPHSIRRN